MDKLGESLFIRGAWIEISGWSRPSAGQGRSSYEERGLKSLWHLITPLRPVALHTRSVDWNTFSFIHSVLSLSLFIRGAWIEIRPWNIFYLLQGRSSYEERGLKLSDNHIDHLKEVALHTRSVDWNTKLKVDTRTDTSLFIRGAWIEIRRSARWRYQSSRSSYEERGLK